MILVGLTGGIATGKSTVAKMFKQFGAVVIDADDLAREVVEPGKPAWRAIVKLFGTTVLAPNRTLDRHALGTIVFHNRGKLRQLERIIHPRVARLQRRLTRAAAENNSKAVVIYDVPLLFETGIEKRFDKIVVVTATLETQLERLRRRNGLPRTVALQRIKSQKPLRQKVRRADYVIDGTLPLTALRRQVKRIHARLCSFA
jgi:dephospho-CoA kinase